MGYPLLVSHSEALIDQFPLLMERSDNLEGHQHVIDIAVSNDAPLSLPNRDEPHNTVDRTTNSVPRINPSQSSSSGRINASYVGRGDSYGYSSPLNSGLWISVELIVTLAQIVASVVILSLSRYKSSEAPLFAWVVGYACGCLATLPILYWRLRNCSRGPERVSVQSHQSSSGTISAGANNSNSSLNQEEMDSYDDSRTNARNSQMRRRISVRLNGIVEHFKMALDCFFAVWFVVGNVWIFGAHSSPSVAPKLYRLCIVFLTFSCIGYALPFLLCATIFCCLPCIISVMGIREDLSKPRGASTETIDALPTYKFRLRKNDSIDSEPMCLKSNKAGYLSNGTQDERVISNEDALCCICLAAYVDNEELRELPCSHLFHTECVDKWLKINASCPLCKLEIREDRSKLVPNDRNNISQQNASDEGDIGLTPTSVS
ncbi:unnamed protein product [Amaranthus hypochondriacus]